jgi:hypothetical protein
MPGMPSNCLLNSSIRPRTQYFQLRSTVPLIDPKTAALAHKMLASVLEVVHTQLFPSQGVAFWFSLFVFTFMFLPTLLIMLAVVVFFGFCYPRLRKD